MKDYPIALQGESLILMSERAVFWERERTLLIADAHFGKAATFRAHAIALPEGNLVEDLDRLSSAIARTGAHRLIVLGDLIHAAKGRDSYTLKHVRVWRESQAGVHMQLVRGNHDTRAGDPPDDWRIEAEDAPVLHAPFVLCHEPRASAAGYVIAGHIHPVAQLAGKGKQLLRVPCFWVSNQCMVLPAFSTFTGGANPRLKKGDRLFGIASQSVVAL